MQTKKRRPLLIRDTHEARIGDMVQAWDARQSLSMDVEDDDGSTIGYIQSIDGDKIEVVLGKQATWCWRTPVTVIQRRAAHVRYSILETHTKFYHDTPEFGDVTEELVKKLEHGPYPGPYTARNVLRILGEDRLKHSDREFRSIKKEKDEVHFANPVGPDYAIIMKVVRHTVLRRPHPKPTAK